MDITIHRVNTTKELIKVPTEYGVEVDVRDHKDNLILQHDPFKDGELFESYLQLYNHGILIINIKSERIEYAVLELLKKYHIQNYFFLDSSFPMIHSLITQGEKNIAIRYSEYESIETVVNMKNMVSWVWVDCFTHLPLNNEIYKRLKETKLKLCLVSPDLLGRGDDISKYREYLGKNNMRFDAVCTKVYNVNKWL